MPASAKHYGLRFFDYLFAARLLHNSRLRNADASPRLPRGRKSRAILAYLVENAGQRVSRDSLIDLLWADRGKAQARGSLRQCLLEIRRAVPNLIESDNGHLWLERDHVDPDTLQGSLRTAELLADLHGITPEYDEWLRHECVKRAAQEWAQLKREIEDMLARAEERKAFPLIERMHQIDPYNEDWVRLAMRAEYQAGHPAGIVKRFNGFRDCLRSDLGVDATWNTRALHDRLLVELTAKESASTPADLGAVPNERLLGMG